jgi:hypothetical protein
LLEDLREGLQSSVEYFAPGRKAERELWVCREFVLNLGVRARLGTFIPVHDEPPDVTYRSARFEVKEMLDRGRRRHQEYRDRLKLAQTATEPDDLLEIYTPLDITALEIGARIESELSNLRKYDSKLKMTLDLLFYVNLKHHHLVAGPMPEPARFFRSGWRSISAVIGWGSLVFYASREAPKFIREWVGTVTVRKFV